MSLATTMKLIGIRNMGCIVERMEWNNKMDLIAYGTEKGEVIIQRLNWQKIVTFPTPGDDVRVRSLSWQTDEALLAVGYSNGKVALLDAEREMMISGLIYEEDIKKVYFTKAIKEKCTLYSYNNYSQDNHMDYLPKLASVNNMDPCNKPFGQRSFPKGSPCFLVVIMNSGKVHLLLLGALQAGSIDLTQYILNPTNFKVYDVRLNGDFSAIYALLRDGEHLKMLHFNNNVLQECMAPMLQLASHCANILETKNYINDTLQCITEAWETVLLEMNNKLTKYANTQPDFMISAHFLELFIFGFATLEFESFLTDELTEKGFKKIANSVDLSLANLQSLVAKQLQCAGVYMFYFLNMTNGFGRVSHFFGELISPDIANEAMRACGAFLLKIFEMQQVITQLIYEMKLFHCWMCLVILRLSHQDIPEDMQIAAEENFALAEYLYTMEDETLTNEDEQQQRRSKFNLERIGQYLENKELEQLQKFQPNHMWDQVLRENECLNDCSYVIPHDKQLSLIQQRDKMLNAIDAVFRKPTESISASFALDTAIICCTLPDFETDEDDFVHCTYMVNETTQSDMFAITITTQEAMIFDFCRSSNTVRCVHINLQPGPFTINFNEDYRNLRFIDLQFYNENAISMLVQNMATKKPQSFFVQFSLVAAENHWSQHAMASHINLMDITIAHSVHDIIDGVVFKNVDGSCEMLAVSGSRKVATILSERKRKMAVFEMEIEEEDDDAEISQTSLMELSKESALSTGLEHDPNI